MSMIAAAIIGAGALTYIGNRKGAKDQSDSIQDATDAQGENNLATARLQNLLNNPNIRTPYGNQDIVVGPDGRPIVTQTLSPAEQQKLETTQRIQQGGLGILEENLGGLSDAMKGPYKLPGEALTDYDPRYAPTERVQTGLDFSGAPAMPRADAQVLQQVEDAMYGQGAQYLDPQYARAEAALKSQLANQGITSGFEVPGAQGSEAFKNAMAQFGEGKQKAYSDLRMSSILGGQTAMDNLYNLALKGRQQGVGEATAKGQFQQQGVLDQANIANQQALLHNTGRAQNLNELTTSKMLPLNMYNALLTGGQVNNPQFQQQQPTNITPSPILGGAQTEAQLAAARMGANAGLFGSVISGLTKYATTPTTTPAPPPDNPYG